MIIKNDDFFKIYNIISKSFYFWERNNTINIRKSKFEEINGSIKKFAFDTRRVDQELDFNPRRNLQNYNRSEQFLSQSTVDRLKLFSKLKNILEEIESEYERDHNWQDSYCRVLLQNINNALRTSQQDGDFSDSQPSLGNFSYLEQLLHARYRLTIDDLINKSNYELKDIFLKKDENLINKDISNLVQIKKNDVKKENYDTLLNMLFGGIKATKENKNITRTVTITINDKFEE